MAIGSGLNGSGGGAAGYNNNNSNSNNRGSSNNNSRNNRGTTSGRKKFGKNLNKVLSNTPAAPPVPVITTSGSGSQSLFRGSSSSNNGLLLLSTKSRSISSGLLQPLGSISSSSNNPLSTSSPQTAHDALLLSAAGVPSGEGGGKKMASGPVWGREKQSSSSLENKQLGGADQAVEKKKPAAAEFLVPMKTSVATVRVEQLGEDVKKLNLHKRDSKKPAIPIKPTEENVTDSEEKPSANKKAVVETKKKQPQHQGNDDEMAVYMSKLAKQRAEKIQSEEEARTLQQKEATALRLKELEEKKQLVESKKKQPPQPPPKQNSAARRDASSKKPAIPIKPTEEDVTDSEEKPSANKKAVVETKKKQPQHQGNDDEMAVYMSKLAKQRAEKIQSEEEARTLQQKEATALRLKELEEKKQLVESKKKQPPQPPPKQNSAARRDASKPSSNIVLEPLGKSKKNAVASPKPKTPVVEKNKKLYDPERPYSSLVGGSNTKSKKNDKQNSKDGANKKEENPVLVHLDSLDDHGRRSNVGDNSGGTRMLFDPTSGSMVKASKKGKQQQSPKMSDDTAEKLRHIDKSLRREKKGGGGGRKDDYSAAATTSHFNKDRKAQKQLAMQRIPRTCGVLFKVDKNGNYVNVDRCQAENGYGAHRVPGGRRRNPAARAQLFEEERLLREHQTHVDGNLNAAAEGFSFRNDPGFVQHQTECEAQQQKILEDAWASLVETDEQQQQQQHVEAEEKPTAKKLSVDDDYAAALAMSPSMIGLNFDQNEGSGSIKLPPAFTANTKSDKSSEPSIDFRSFAFADNDAAASNPFGGGLWGNTAGGNDLGALSGWDFTSTTSEKQDGGKTSTSKSSKLNLWGSSVLDSPRKKSSEEQSNEGMG